MVIPFICSDCYAIVHEELTYPVSEEGISEQCLRLAEFATKIGNNSSIPKLGLTIDTHIPSIPVLTKHMNILSERIEKQVICVVCFKL